MKRGLVITTHYTLDIAFRALIHVSECLFVYILVKTLKINTVLLEQVRFLSGS